MFWNPKFHSELEINEGKTNEFLLSSWSDTSDQLQPLTIIGSPVETVNCFKYVGTVIDGQLNFTENTDYTGNKATQRFYLLRKLNDLNVSKQTLELVHRNLVESILFFNMVMWYGNLNVKNKLNLQRQVNIASEIVGKPQMQHSDKYKLNTKSKVFQITSDPCHPLHSHSELLHSGRRHRQERVTKNM